MRRHSIGNSFSSLSYCARWCNIVWIATNAFGSRSLKSLTEPLRRRMVDICYRTSRLGGLSRVWGRVEVVESNKKAIFNLTLLKIFQTIVNEPLNCFQNIPDLDTYNARLWRTIVPNLYVRGPLQVCLLKVTKIGVILKYYLFVFFSRIPWNSTLCCCIEYRNQHDEYLEYIYERLLIFTSTHCFKMQNEGVENEELRG